MLFLHCPRKSRNNYLITMLCDLVIVFFLKKLQLSQSRLKLYLFEECKLNISDFNKTAMTRRNNGSPPM